MIIGNFNKYSLSPFVSIKLINFRFFFVTLSRFSSLMVLGSFHELRLIRITLLEEDDDEGDDDDDVHRLLCIGI